MNDIPGHARQYLIEFLQGKRLRTETKHPWRKPWEFIALHTFRVEKYVLKILALEPHSLTGREIVLLQTAALLHDIARLEVTENHASDGAQIAKQWLTAHYASVLAEKEIEKIVQMVANHSGKGIVETDFSTAVLKDADILDEIGALSIFMSANWIGQQSPFFFHDLLKRVSEFEIPFCDQKLSILNTAGARKILLQKKDFIQNFITQLANELETEASFEQLASVSDWSS